MGGAATLKRIAIFSRHNEREHRFDLTLFLPNARPGPAPVFLLLNNRPVSNTDPTRREQSDFWPAEQVIARGYAIAAIQVSDLAPDDKERYRDGVIRLFEDGFGGACGHRVGGAGRVGLGREPRDGLLRNRLARGREARRRRRPLARAGRRLSGLAPRTNGSRWSSPTSRGRVERR